MVLDEDFPMATGGYGKTKAGSVLFVYHELLDSTILAIQARIPNYGAPGSYAFYP